MYYRPFQFTTPLANYSVDKKGSPKNLSIYGSKCIGTVH